ncbi:hypothetical protein [Sphingomonas desiccabilis]|uniref:Uncharacterized protein n=2 Tax=Sphingomonas desiccabilis TaxID=429134 RepID=A0A4Q2J0J8_9SPHN|nr:hypothetical protein [Sphingomonas desiccabilis]MBB3910398.1 hypothetical protein [Sphingomonas desiccabilis]RXZ35054.1 hypothetical protein EO081_05245 [Sphingomonas desiccabilis]
MRWRPGLLALALAGCSGEQPAPAPSATPQPAATSTPAPAPIDVGALAPGELPAPELAGVAPAAGQWHTGKGSARFVDAGGTGAFALRCDSARRELVLLRSGTADGGAMLRVVTGMAAASYPVVASGRRVEARAGIDDRFLAALQKVKGTIGVSLGEGQVLAVPADPAIAAVISFCRGR